MQLIFEHLQINGITGSASAYIPGPMPDSKLDRASYFEIQASFHTLPKLHPRPPHGSRGLTLPHRKLHL